jgi:hypothetical protein
MGGSTAEFLTLGAGARSLGMGEAYGPIAEGPEAIYWNPAGLAQIRSVEASYSRSEFLQFFHHDFLAAAAPAGFLKGTVAIAYSRFSQQALPLVTNANINVGDFVPHSDSVSFGYAHSFDLDEFGSHANERDYFDEAWRMPQAERPFKMDEAWRGNLMVGAAVKTVNESLYQRTASAIAFDGGAIFRPAELQNLRLSFAFRNAGSKEQFIRENESLPAEADFGAAWDARSWKSRWLFAFEAAVPYYGQPYGKLGVEYARPVGDGATLSLRGGFKSLAAMDLSPVSALTFGVGLRYTKLNVDFGFEPAAELGQTYRLTVGMRW